MEDITKELEVLNSLTSIGEYLRDKELSRPTGEEEEELFNAIKNFEQVQKYILEEIKKIGK
jgi:hypothetical protein